MKIISLLFLLFLCYHGLMSLSKDKNKVNDKKIDGSLEKYYLNLLGLENQKGISPQDINDAFLIKVELLGDPAGETKYLDDLKAARYFLLDTCNLKAALN